MSVTDKFVPLPILGDAAPAKAAWRSLDELAETPEYREFASAEFPEKADAWIDPLTRRQFLKVVGGGAGLAFLAACRKPLQQIFPMNQAPENVIPGKPLYYASALTFGGYARGVIVESHEGRPTKIEGNPAQPDSLGATDVFMQAAILDLYDPDRSQRILNRGVVDSWDAFIKEMGPELTIQRANGGSGMRILSEVISSPTLLAQRERFLREFPKAKWIQYDPIGRYNTLQGARQAFGEALEPQYDLKRADVILALDADFMGDGPAKLRLSREFSDRRQLVQGRTAMNRLYVVEPTPSITGSAADHRLPLPASWVPAFLAALARALGVSAPATADLPPAAAAWIPALAKDLQAARGRSIVMVGESQPASVHALAHAVNAALGNVGSTVRFAASPVAASIDGREEFAQLALDMEEKRVDLLFILGGNPVYHAPAGLLKEIGFTEALNRVHFRVRLGLYEDETSFLSHWHLPQAHALESWNDARASDGTATIAQPLIEPLYGGRTPQEILSVILDEAPANAHALVKGYWQKSVSAAGFDAFWQTSLHDGIVAESRFPTRTPSLRAGAVSAMPKPVEGLELALRPDPTIYDGRFANNGWLQELPKPVTKLTWENALYLSPVAAARLSVDNGDVVALESEGRGLEAPVCIVPGQAENSATLTLGYGRTMAGRIGSRIGANAYLLRTADYRDAFTVQPQKTSRRVKLAMTQLHFSVEGRDIVRGATLADYKTHPKFAYKKHDWPEETLYDSPPLDQEQGWGMSIDMTTCIGCNACVVACQSENSIAVVGKDQVVRGREMHWLRIDQYFAGSPDNPEITNQPMACVHCENAPCEPVCPVGATTHSAEGLNQMVYNRCIGTRYCSNNCPYKVRRFNFLEYTDSKTEQYKLMRNPDVTVRMRGVMEKCTYCVQRIQEVKIDAAKTNRPIKDGEIVTACQSACPTHAIVFGNIKDSSTEAARLREEPRTYAVLGDLNVRPRTTYLAKVRNVNPELA